MGNWKNNIHEPEKLKAISYKPRTANYEQVWIRNLGG
jgi:hypothetical protein